MLESARNTVEVRPGKGFLCATTKAPLASLSLAGQNQSQLQLQLELQLPPPRIIGAKQTSISLSSNKDLTYSA